MERVSDLRRQAEEPPFSDEVAQVFASYPQDKRAFLLELRSLIFECAQRLYGPACLTESLKWGEPSYRPLPQFGRTAIRLHWKPKFGERAGIEANSSKFVTSSIKSMMSSLICNSFDISTPIEKFKLV